MSPEERDELMQFILQSQSDAAEHHREMMEEHRELTKKQREMTEQQRETSTEVQTLAAACRDLVEVARIHSRRLDRLEGLNG